LLKLKFLLLGTPPVEAIKYGFPESLIKFYKSGYGGNF
jgi:hypothetical protein